MKTKERNRILLGLAVLGGLYFLFSAGDSAEEAGGGVVARGARVELRRVYPRRHPRRTSCLASIARAPCPGVHW